MYDDDDDDDNDNDVDDDDDAGVGGGGGGGGGDGDDDVIDKYLMFFVWPNVLSISIIAVQGLPLIETRANFMESSGSS